MQVQLGKVLGKGSFGETFQGTWRGQDVAVKCVRIKSHDEASSFLREADTLSALHHPNIMQLHGEALYGARVSVLGQGAVAQALTITEPACAGQLYVLACSCSRVRELRQARRHARRASPVWWWYHPPQRACKCKVWPDQVQLWSPP